jgi:hypothetical protein
MKTTVASLVILCATAWCGGALAQEQHQLSAEPGGPELEVDTDLPVGPLLLGSFGLAMVAVGAGFGWQADQEYEDWETARKTGDPLGEMDELADDVKAHSVTANVLMFSGAAVAAIGVIWLIFAGGDEDDNGPGQAETALLEPSVGPDRAGLVVHF